MSGPYTEDPQRSPMTQVLPSHLVERYREIIRNHTPEPQTKLCPVCRKKRCIEYTWATGRLIASGQL